MRFCILPLVFALASACTKSQLPLATSAQNAPGTGEQELEQRLKAIAD